MSTTKEQKSRFTIIYKLRRIEPNRTECEVLKTRLNRIESRFFYSFRSLVATSYLMIDNQMSHDFIRRKDLKKGHAIL